MIQKALREQRDINANIGFNTNNTGSALVITLHDWTPTEGVAPEEQLRDLAVFVAGLLPSTASYDRIDIVLEYQDKAGFVTMTNTRGLSYEMAELRSSLAEPPPTTGADEPETNPEPEDGEQQNP